MVVPPQHFSCFFPEAHGRESFRPALEAVCRGDGALPLRTMASPSNGGTVMFATDHTGSAMPIHSSGLAQGIGQLQRHVCRTSRATITWSRDVRPCGSGLLCGTTNVFLRDLGEGPGMPRQPNVPSQCISVPIAKSLKF